MPRRHRLDTLIELYAISTDILHRRCPNCAWDESQVLQATPSSGHGVRHKLMPGLAAPDLHLDRSRGQSGLP